MRVSRTTATVLITALFLIVIIGILLLLLPALEAEILGFVNRIPAYAQAISERLKPALASVAAVLPESQVQKLTDGASGVLGNAFEWVFGVLQRLLSGGVALVNMLSLLVIAPVVAFYLLRDWDRMVAHIVDFLPRRHSQTKFNLWHKRPMALWPALCVGRQSYALFLGPFTPLASALLVWTWDWLSA